VGISTKLKVARSPYSKELKYLGCYKTT